MVLATAGAALAGSSATPLTSGASLASSGAALTPAGAALAGSGAAPTPAGAALGGSGAVPATAGAALARSGTVPTTAGAALASSGTVPATAGAALARSGAAPASAGVALASSRTVASTAAEAPEAPGELAAADTAADDPDFGENQTAAPAVLHEETPDVPPNALRTIRGHIKLAVRVKVDQSGDVVHVSLASHSPSRYFIRLAMQTARRWKFVAAGDAKPRHCLVWFDFTRRGAETHADARMRYAQRD
jgi:TonB family protein